MRRLVAVLIFVALAGSSCAHAPKAVATCVATPALEAAAWKALAGGDYETAIARELGGVASCLVVAAVQAAIESARTLKLSGDVDSAAVELHGQAWMSAHVRAGPAAGVGSGA